jgi:membrane glycosyltransferase
LTAFTYFWVALSVGTAVIGLIHREKRAAVPSPKGTGIDVAILLPMYGEPAKATIHAAVKLLAGVNAADTVHRFSLHILSDSRSELARAAEAQAVRGFKAAFPNLAIHYRWRPTNTDFKSGNLREWVTRQGHAYEAMLVLDADSVMHQNTVIYLADEMASDPAVGLLQTIPRLLPGRTFWQRMQEFSAHVYGVTLGRGLSRWAGDEFHGAQCAAAHTCFCRKRGPSKAEGPAADGRRNPEP